MEPGENAVVLAPGEGKQIIFVGNEMTFKVASADTNGAFSLCEFTAEAGFPGPPLHIHHGHDETFYMLEGEMQFRLGDGTVCAGHGSFLLAPKGVAHSFWNPGSKSARMLVLCTPAGYEKYFEEIAHTFPPGTPPDLEKWREIHKKYNTEAIGPPPGQ